ncbi:hypothetical protein BAUCODRAFT_281096 [Baudoinia panamericana UAMH 10762]|uniref:Anaphase-promoting complex subunit 4 n=1 Tax=Baudoinia panamericana (strain UAMH 10762) TaxID=717646 RepID=M2MZT2_BAUPA|nr:uncharacterized protein BAUCODRAFT_281096 [Baudoinia panamericana UAMH 10762]EMC92184.1 hypothetical protein BAUCODRAFT_281096 [Baudoinia panamericana UAMH 10762]
MLPVISHTHLSSPAIDPSVLVAYCDPHDLVAIATENVVVVYRINGQVAFTVKPSKDFFRVQDDAKLAATALAWKQDGKLLACGWNDGSYGLYSGENGRLISHGWLSGRGQSPTAGNRLDDQTDLDGAVVTCFSWMRHDGQSSAPSQPTVSADELDTEAWFAREDGSDADDNSGAALINEQLRPHGHATIEKLARSIVTLDVTTVFPKLSALPSHGLRVGSSSVDGGKFASQAQTDLAFESVVKAGAADDVDALLIYASDGGVEVFMDAIVPVGTRKIHDRPICAAAHAKSFSHAILSRDHDRHLHLCHMDLPLQTLGSPLLYVVSQNTKRIQSLLAYVSQTCDCMVHDFRTGLQFPDRLIANAQTELEEKQEGDLIMNLYHLAMTTDFTPTMLEWLIDIVKETNHKRWDQAVNSLYTHIQTHLFMHFRPGLERLSIATTTLRGHARFHEGSTNFDVPPGPFTKLLDAIDSLGIVAEKMLLMIIDEHKQFKAFSKWLRVMIEIGVAGPGTKGAIETEERENPNIEYSLVLEYIERTMTRSRLARHLQAEPTNTEDRSAEDILALQCSASTAEPYTLIQLDQSLSAQPAIHTFSESFRPGQLHIGGRKGKRVCVVFGNDGKEWLVLDLDAKKGDVDKDAEMAG